MSVEQLKEFQEKANAGIRNLLKNTALIPLELIFVGRNINIVRSNNKLLGAPINRIGIMAEYAQATVVEYYRNSNQNLSFTDTISLNARGWVFSAQIFLLNLFYRTVNIFNKVSTKIDQNHSTLF